MQTQRQHCKPVKLTERGRIVLSIVPNAWDIIDLGSVTHPITKGTTPTTEGDVYVKEGIPFLKVESIKNDGTLDGSKIAYITADVHKKLLRSQLQENDILFTIAGTLGRVGIVTGEYVPSNTNQAIAIIRIKDEKYCQSFLNHILRSDLIQKQIRIEKTIMAQPNLSLTQVSNFKIIKPSLVEQQKIALILSNVDSLIRQTKKNTEQTQILKKGLVQKLFTKGIGHTKFTKIKSLFGRYEEIPEEWNFVKISQVCKKITSGGTPNRAKAEYYDNGDILWIKSGELNESYLNDSEEKITTLGLKNSSAKIFPRNTVLIAMYGATIGKTSILNKEASTNQAICAILPDNSFIPFYLQQLLVSKKNVLISLGMGAGQPNISQEIIKNFKVGWATSLEEQQKIALILSNVDSQIQKQKECQSNLETLKKGLMQKLLTGQIRVKI